MSAAARPIEVETLVPAAHVHDLIAENRKLRLNLTSANAARDNLFKQLNYAVAAGKVKDTFLVDGMLTTVSTTGRVMQLQTKAIDTATEAGYRAEWVEIAPVPNTAAAYLAASKDEDRRDALALGMDVIADDDEEISA